MTNPVFAIKILLATLLIVHMALAALASGLDSVEHLLWAIILFLISRWGVEVT